MWCLAGSRCENEGLVEFWELAVFPACDDRCVVGGGGREMMAASGFAGCAGG